MDFKFEIFVLVEKPVAQVYAAVYEPQQLSKYFTTGGASAPLQAGETVTWEFHDFPGAFPVKVLKSEQKRVIAFEWEANEGGYNTTTEFSFEDLGPHTTKVTVKESGWQHTQKGLESSYGNCFGWTHMLCCLKVWLEHGINLREGSFKPSEKVA
ncbi:MAG: SRPBCC domain-containing protein [Pseudomonadota bacterium]